MKIPIKLFKYILILFLIGVHSVAKSSSNTTNHPNIGLEVSSWKPSLLDDNPTDLFDNVPGTSLSYGVFFATPWLGNLALRATLTQWQQKDLSDRTDVQKVRLRPLSVDLKNRILGGTMLSPFVCYGVLFIWAAEKPVGAKSYAEEKSQFGYGGSVGAGLDVLFSRRWAVGVEFQYLYAKLANTIGLTDDYSGPKFSAKVFYLF